MDMHITILLMKLICQKCSERIYNVKQARTLIKSLMIIGAILGVMIGTVGSFIPWFLPNMFTSDLMVIKEVIFLLNFYKYVSFINPE